MRSGRYDLKITACLNAVRFNSRREGNVSFAKLSAPFAYGNLDVYETSVLT